MVNKLVLYLSNVQGIEFLKSCDIHLRLPRNVTSACKAYKTLRSSRNSKRRAGKTPAESGCILSVNFCLRFKFFRDQI